MPLLAHPSLLISALERLTGYQWSSETSKSSDGQFSSEDIIAYVYAQMHSNLYRQNLRDYLRSHFPLFLLPSNGGLFNELVQFGTELVANHLLNADGLRAPITEYSGPNEATVDRVTYADGMVWLDKKQTCGFAGVPEAVWNFHIGGYQVCEKWLKDRKGRQLSKEDIAHYQKIIAALAETIKIMAEIDKTIEAHGGWPAAFITDPEKLEGLRSKKA